MSRAKKTKELLDQRGAQWTSIGDAEVVEHYGDAKAEYEAVIDGGLAAIERGERETLVISGEDAVPWLQGLVTNDLHDLVDEGSGHRNSMVNTTGRFVGECRMLHLPEMLVLDLEAGTLETGLLSHLRQHVITEKVEITDRSEATWRLGIYGERAAALLAEFVDWKHELGDRPNFYGSWARWRRQDLIAQRVVWMDVPGFELSCEIDAAVAVLEGLESTAGELALFGQQTFETLRIEAGVPRFGVELHEKVLPLEAGFDDAISYTKGCYLGQEIIARVDTLGTPAKLLRRIVIDDDDVPEVGTSLYPGDGGERAVGKIESAAYSPRFDAPVALAYVKRGHNEPGEVVRIGEGEVEGRLEDILRL